MTDSIELTPSRLISGLIQYRDADNSASAGDLGAIIAAWLTEVTGFARTADLIAFVERTNPDKRMGAGRLAELIVAEFQLDEEK
jgi:hypothetical protein